ncbi:hypothetical protein PMI35_00397 [Pseudomonas sp. GM78]|nr:hypothetical protein PMI35_00397 [Pseudomonas sp. GM78]
MPLENMPVMKGIRNGTVSGEQIGKLWYVDWAAFSRSI